MSHSQQMLHSHIEYVKNSDKLATVKLLLSQFQMIHIESFRDVKCHHEATSVLNLAWSITTTMQKRHSLFMVHANIPIASQNAFALYLSLEPVLGGWGELAWRMWESPFSFQLQVCLCGCRNLQIYKSITSMGKEHAKLGTTSNTCCAEVPSD